jgi:hypothetical protein
MSVFNGYIPGFLFSDIKIFFRHIITKIKVTDHFLNFWIAIKSAPPNRPAPVFLRVSFARDPEGEKNPPRLIARLLYSSGSALRETLRGRKWSTSERYPVAREE